MKLYSSTRSPFVRKVLVCAHEAGVIGRIERALKIVSFLKGDEEVGAHNPLGQIPTLVLEDGTSLYDSGVICEYLSQQKPELQLVPSDPAARLDMARRQAEADGLLDTFMRWYGERRRAADPMSPQYVAACRGKFLRVVDAWEAAVPGWEGRRLDVGFIAIGCALAYADFRFATEDWRAGRQHLARWHAALCTRPSFAATNFQDG